MFAIYYYFPVYCICMLLSSLTIICGLYIFNSVPSFNSFFLGTSHFELRGPILKLWGQLAWFLCAVRSLLICNYMQYRWLVYMHGNYISRRVLLGKCIYGQHCVQTKTLQDNRGFAFLHIASVFAPLIKHGAGADGRVLLWKSINIYLVLAMFISSKHSGTGPWSWSQDSCVPKNKSWSMITLALTCI